jgi:hypothetical protein
MKPSDESVIPTAGKDKHKHKTKINFTFDKISTDDAPSLAG